MHSALYTGQFKRDVKRVKKRGKDMAKQREIFMQGAVTRGVDPKLATTIFDLMEKFAGYGFNKSHSAAYALLSYQTAWLKTHYPAEFMAAVLSADMDNTDKVVYLIEDCHLQKLEVLSPDINRSEYQFSVPDSNTVLYGLGAIKGVGEAALDGIIRERNESGAYQDLYDFCRRSDMRKVNRRVMEALIKAGTMDELGPNRASLMASLNNAIQLAEQKQKDALAGQDDMFGSIAAPDEHANVHIVEVDDWDDEQRLFNEKETLGLYLTGHPIQRYEQEIREFTDCTLANAADRSARRLLSCVSAKCTSVPFVPEIQALAELRGRVLLVDDESQLLDIGEQILDALGCQTVTTSDTFRVSMTSDTLAPNSRYFFRSAAMAVRAGMSRETASAFSSTIPSR